MSACSMESAVGVALALLGGETRCRAVVATVHSGQALRPSRAEGAVHSAGDPEQLRAGSVMGVRPDSVVVCVRLDGHEIAGRSSPAILESVK